MTLPPYETSDVYLASYLLCQGATLLGIERVGPRRTIFRFESTEFLHSILRVYWSNDRVLVPPTQLFHALRKLKSRIRGQRPTPRTMPPGRGTEPADSSSGTSAYPSPGPHAE